MLQVAAPLLPINLEIADIRRDIQSHLSSSSVFVQSLQQRHGQLIESLSLDFREIVTNFEISGKKISHHVRVLESALSQPALLKEEDFPQILATMEQLSLAKLEMVIQSIEICSRQLVINPEEINELKHQERAIRLERKDLKHAARRWGVIKLSSKDEPNNYLAVYSTWKNIILHSSEHNQLSKTEAFGYELAYRFIREVKTDILSRKSSEERAALDQELNGIKLLASLAHLYRIMDVLAEKKAAQSTPQKEFEIRELENAFNTVFAKYEKLYNKRSKPGHGSVDPLLVLKKYEKATPGLAYLRNNLTSPSHIIRIKEATNTGKKVSAYVEDLLADLFENEDDVENKLMGLLDNFHTWSEKNPSKALDLLPHIISSCSILSKNREVSDNIVSRLRDTAKLVSTRYAVLEKMAEEEHSDLIKFVALAEVGRFAAVADHTVRRRWLRDYSRKLPQAGIDRLKGVNLLELSLESQNLVERINESTRFAEICQNEVRQHYFLEIMTERLNKSIINYARQDQVEETPNLNFVENISTYFQAIREAKSKRDMFMALMPIILPVSSIVIALFFPESVVALYLKKFSIAPTIYKFVEKLMQGRIAWFGPFTSLADYISPTRNTIVERKKLEKKAQLQREALLVSRERFNRERLNNLVNEWVHELKSYGIFHHTSNPRIDEDKSKDHLDAIMNTIHEHIDAKISEAERNNRNITLDRYLEIYVKELDVKKLRTTIETRLPVLPNQNSNQRRLLIDSAVNLIIHQKIENSLKSKLRDAIANRYSNLFRFESIDNYLSTAEVKDRLTPAAMEAVRAESEAPIKKILRDSLAASTDSEDDHARFAHNNSISIYLDAIRSNLAAPAA